MDTVVWRAIRGSVPVCALVLGGVSVAHAATIGPDAFGYRATDEVPFVFQNISGTGTRVLAGTDDGAVVAPIGFDFSLYGTVYNSVGISTNGLLTFGGTNSSFSNQNLTTTAVSATSASMAPFWDDLYLVDSGTDAVYHQTFGIPGLRTVIVQWNQIDRFAGTPSAATFQVMLSESGAFFFNYSSVNFGTAESGGASATVGIQGPSGNANGNNLQWSFNQAVLRGEQSILFARDTRPVPEPTTMVLLGAGLIGVAAKARRRRSK
jgi:hypothetical protein